MNKVLQKTRLPSKVFKIENYGKFVGFYTESTSFNPLYDSTLINLNRSAILLFETYHSFKYFLFSGNNLAEYYKKMHFLVYIEESFNFQEILNQSSPMIFHMSFLHTLDDPVFMHTLIKIETFKAPDCSEIKLKYFNAFSGLRRKWINSNFFSEKVKDFHGCALKFMIYNELLIFDPESKGMGRELIDEIAKSLNFVVQHHPIGGKNDRTSAGVDTFKRDIIVLVKPIREFLKRKFTNVGRAYGSLPLKHLYVTHPFTSTETILLTSQTKQYSQFEKNLMPFEVEVWHWTMASLATGLLVIFVLKFTPEYVQKFVFGSRVKTPVLNLM